MIAMGIWWGSGFFGKVDRVDGEMYVVTRIGHLCSIPLIPLESYIVEAGSETRQVLGISEFTGQPTALSWRSYRWAWVRFFMWVGAFLGFPLLINIPEVGPLLGLAWQAASIIGLVTTRRGLKASPSRVMELEAELRQELTHRIGEPNHFDSL